MNISVLSFKGNLLGVDLPSNRVVGDRRLSILNLALKVVLLLAVISLPPLKQVCQ